MPPGYVPLHGRRLAVEIVFGLLVVVALAAIVSGIRELALMDRLVAGEPVTDAELTANDSRQAIVGGLGAIVYVAAAVAFIVWLHRAYKNVDAVAPEQRRYGTGWAIGGWFVPIMNLFRPKQVINDVWRAGGPLGARPDERVPGRLLLTWWILWLLAGLATRVAIRDYEGGETPAEYRMGTIAYLVSDSLDVITALFAIAVVRVTTARLDQAAREEAAVAAASLAAPERPDGAAPAPERPDGAAPAPERPDGAAPAPERPDGAAPERPA